MCTTMTAADARLIALYLLRRGLTMYDVAVLLRAHPKAVAALLA